MSEKDSRKKLAEEIYHHAVMGFKEKSGIHAYATLDTIMAIIHREYPDIE